MRPDTEPVPWERLPRESRQAYGAFGLYRDMGPHERSHVKVGRELGKSVTLINRWSSHWSWVKRADAWDAEQERIRLETIRTRQLQSVEDDLKPGEALTAKAARNLIALPDTGLSAQEVVRLAHEGLWIKRVSLGLPMEKQRVTAAVLHEPHNSHKEDEDALAQRILSDPHFANLACEFFAALAEPDSGSNRKGIDRTD